VDICNSYNCINFANHYYEVRRIYLDHMINDSLDKQKDLKENPINVILLIIDLIIAIPVLFFLNMVPDRTHWCYVLIYLIFYTTVAVLIWI